MAAANSIWNDLSSQFSEVAARAGKSIVAIHGGRRLSASGVLWRMGVVVTASHMLRRTDDLSLTLPDKSRTKTSFAGRDPGTDLAILRIESAPSATPAESGAGARLQVGQIILAVGRSGLGDLAATAGIVARLGEAWQTWRGGQIDSLLRPDVTLYPGQAGSALVDSSGSVLGINTPALARASTITIPAATVNRVVDEILEHGGVFRPYLGLAMQAVALPQDLAGKLKIEQDAALMVMQVEAESPSAKAGITLGDLIVTINEHRSGGIDDIQRTLLRAKRGESVKLTYVRGGQPATATVKLAERPQR